MSTEHEKEFEIINTLKCGRFNVTVSQVKMSNSDREIENNRIRKQFIMAQLK